MPSDENINDEKRLNSSLNDEKHLIEIPPTRRSKRMARKIPGKVNKPHRSRLTQQRLPSKNTSSANAKTVPALRRNNAFYQGTVVGSFLGATLSTVITTVVAKLFG
ncbi:PRM3 (YPL192C) [Zygosaccharomyces parabailii]|nr:PRM3 (YPL192C) [Zygosaccharomyces parabailii]CDH17938.1 uncharacterized protein ZBAI_09726 [Zygosaccharomyces bailii ISA1307]